MPKEPQQVNSSRDVKSVDARGEPGVQLLTNGTNTNLRLGSRSAYIPGICFVDYELQVYLWRPRSSQCRRYIILRCLSLSHHFCGYLRNKAYWSMKVARQISVRQAPRHVLNLTEGDHRDGDGLARNGRLSYRAELGWTSLQW